MTINYELFGDYIRNRRKDLNMTQTMLANIMDVSQGYVSDLESGKDINPTVSTIEKIANALDITPEELLHIIFIGNISKESPNTFNVERFQCLANEVSKLPSDSVDKIIQIVNLILEIKK